MSHESGAEEALRDCRPDTIPKESDVQLRPEVRSLVLLSRDNAVD